MRPPFHPAAALLSFIWGGALCAHELAPQLYLAPPTPSSFRTITRCISGYIGEYVMHCHILDHEDSGMMANILIVPDGSAPGGGLGMPAMKTMSNGTMTHEMHR